MIWIFFYWLIRISAGCELLDRTSIEVSKYSGEDVLLPCSCVHGQTHSRGLRWIKTPGASNTFIYKQGRIQEDYRDRIQLFIEDSPGNLSLLISRLTKTDDGIYRCEDGPYRDITLRITGSPPVPPTTTTTSTTPGSEPTDEKDTEGKPVPYFIIIPAALLLILLLGGGAAFLYFRCKGVKSAEMHNQNPKSGIAATATNAATQYGYSEQQMYSTIGSKTGNQDDVTYTTVVHGGNPNVAQVRMSIDDRTEYASIRTT